MIKIERIEIEEFRGIRKLSLDLKKKNFGICGPNGTGKSGIVDALEFVLTGDITRLGGAGTAELSIKEHAPHVDARKKPDKSSVKVHAFIPSLNRQVTIHRSVKSPGSPTIEPADPKVKEIVSKLATHPEFALSRREIVKYILTPAGQRSKDVQSLLRLDQLEKLRQALQKVANETKREADTAALNDTRAKADLVAHLGIKAASKVEMLAAVNERRKTLGLEPLADFAAGTSMKEGVPGKVEAQPKPQRVIKSAALVELELLDTHLTTAAGGGVQTAREESTKALAALAVDPTALRSFRRQVLIEQGIELLEEDACPLCDLKWDMAALQLHLQEKLARAKLANEQMKLVQRSLQTVIQNLEDVRNATDRVAAVGIGLSSKDDAADVSAFAKSCVEAKNILDRVVDDPSLINEALELLSKATALPASACTAVEAIKKAVNALPDPSKEQEARDYLVLAQEHYDRCRSTQQEKDATIKGRDTAAAVLETYGSVSNKVLEGIYDAVQKDFTEFYQFINRDDEGGFDGQLIPSPAKLALDVDFYGRGKFPPGAYHSEGHQDAMGLCLYLALMKHTLGNDFTFAVLDDVLMSVDAGHRREVCSLLKTKFPNTQFVLTTHDPVWLQFMGTENLISGKAMFGGWTVDSGPQVWDEGDVWSAIAERLAKNDVPSAAATLRRYLEYVATILADNFRAPVEYHGNGQYDLGDLMPGVTREWRSLVNRTLESAKSWGQEMKPFEELAAEAKNNIARSAVEHWMINKALHYNAWASLQSDEFRAVADAFKTLLDSMKCKVPECAEYVRVTPHKGEKESLRCGCGALTLNLVKK